MNRRGAFLVCLAAAGLLAGLAPAGARAEVRGHHCRGTLSSPGTLSGTYRGNVLVNGVCQATGATTVRGSLVLRRGSVLLAFVNLTVNHDVWVRRGATLVAGADPDAGGGDQPSFFHLRGDLTATDALGVVIHGGKIEGNVNQTGGGGGFTCQPVGVFAQLGSPAFSVYEGMEIEGMLAVSRLHSCWFGITHNTEIHNVRVIRNQLADPDAVEILDNTITHNIICRGNSMMWDSADTVEGSLYPRQWEPNRVGGRRAGQCVTAPALTEGGSSPGPF
jgi:hypothetical protein